MAQYTHSLHQKERYRGHSFTSMIHAAHHYINRSALKTRQLVHFPHNQSHVDLKFYKIQLYTKWFGYTSWHDWNAISRLYLQQQLEQYELL